MCAKLHIINENAPWHGRFFAPWAQGCGRGAETLGAGFRTAVSGMDCEMGRIALRNGPFHAAKWAVLHCDSAHFALQNGPFYKPKRPVLQHTMYQYITQSHTKQPIKGPTAAHAPAPQAHVPHPLPNRTVPHRTAANAQPDGSLCTARHQSAHCHFVNHTLHFRPRCQAVRTNARLICHDGHFFRIRSHSFRLNY